MSGVTIMGFHFQAHSIALLEWGGTYLGFGVLMLCFEHLSDQKFIILEVYIWYGGACDIFRAKSIFRTNLAREKMMCDLVQTIPRVQ